MPLPMVRHTVRLCALLGCAVSIRLHALPVLAAGAIDCPSGSPEIIIPGNDNDGIRFDHTGASGTYRIEVFSPTGLSDAAYGNYTWANWPSDDRARHHGGHFFVVRNAHPQFGPDQDPVTQSLGGQRVANATLGIGGQLMDPPYNSSRTQVANGTRGDDASITLNHGDFLSFIVNGIRGISNTQQGSYAQNQGAIHIRICPISLQPPGNCTAQDPRIACFNQAIGFTGPQSSEPNINGTLLLFWRNGGSKQVLLNAAEQCGLEVPRLGNFSETAMRNVVRRVIGGAESNVLLAEACNSSTVNAYRNAGFTIQNDVAEANGTCTQPNLQYNFNKPLPITPPDGIGDNIGGLYSVVCRPQQTTPQCRDGVDNDGDGATDHGTPNVTEGDFSCFEPDDNDETNPKSECQDGVDNDGDGKTDFPQDPGCNSRHDNVERDLVCLGGAAPQLLQQTVLSSTQFPGDPASRSFPLNPGTYIVEYNEGAWSATAGQWVGLFNISFQSSTGPVTRQIGSSAAYPTQLAARNVNNERFEVVDLSSGQLTLSIPAANQGRLSAFIHQCPVPATANLSITKSGPGTVTRGGTISYSVTASNAGPATATNAVIADVIPGGFTFNAGASSPGCVLDNASVLCNNFNLVSGDTRTFTIVFNVPTIANCSQTTVNNVATVSSSTTDPVSGNNTSNTVTSTVQCQATTPQCRDGIDNDGDGAIDAPSDFSCSSPDDDDETFPKAQCQDGVDNDGDVYTDFPNDPGCSSKQDNDEFNAVSSSSASSVSSVLSSSASSRIPQCRDGVDNDGDGAVDFSGGDLSCSSPEDDDETFPKAQCQDSSDNDGDGFTDFPNDPGCSSRQDNDESNDGVILRQCNDSRDNDGDGYVDYPADPGCIDRQDDREDDDLDRRRFECSDARDNDGDGLVDYPADPGCESRTDDREDSDRPSVDRGVTVLKIADRTEAQPGDLLSYTITVRNDSGRVIEDVVVEDTCDAGLLEIIDPGGAEVIGGNLLRWRVGRMEQGGVRTFTYRGRVSLSARHGDSVSNRVRVSGRFGETSGSSTVRVIERLPQTGGEELGGGNSYLTRVRRNQGDNGRSSASPIGLLSMLGVAAGTIGFVARRLYG